MNKGIRLTIESRPASEIPSLSRDGIYFFFKGEDAKGEAFCGSADDLPTTLSMIQEMTDGLDYGEGFDSLWITKHST